MARAHLHAGFLRLQIQKRKYVLLFAFPQQKFLNARTSILLYQYSACLVFFLQLNLNFMINNVLHYYVILPYMFSLTVAQPGRNVWVE
jgi:hypothetical protein